MTEKCMEYLSITDFFYLSGHQFSASLQTDDAGHVGAAVLAHVACVVGLQTSDVRRN